MSKKNLIRLAALLAAVLVLALAFVTIRSTVKQHICAADNQQFQTTLKYAQGGDVLPLSKALSQMGKDDCKVVK